MTRPPDIPGDLVERIREAVRMGNYRLRAHAFEHLIERRVDPRELRLIVLYGEAIEYNPIQEGASGSGVLFLGVTADARALHVKVVEETRPSNRYFIVTVYEPDPERWLPGFKTRRTGGTS